MMKWLNFVPLLVWALGFLALAGWLEHLRQIDGRAETIKEESVAGAKLWLFGCGFFLALGVLLSV